MTKEALVAKAQMVELTCTECGDTYRRAVISPDAQQDRAEGITAGTCDACWLEALVEMRSGR